MAVISRGEREEVRKTEGEGPRVYWVLICEPKNGTWQVCLWGRTSCLGINTEIPKSRGVELRTNRAKGASRMVYQPERQSKQKQLIEENQKIILVKRLICEFFSRLIILGRHPNGGYDLRYSER